MAEIHSAFIQTKLEAVQKPKAASISILDAETERSLCLCCVHLIILDDNHSAKLLCTVYQPQSRPAAKAHFPHHKKKTPTICHSWSARVLKMICSLCQSRTSASLRLINVYVPLGSAWFLSIRSGLIQLSFRRI